MSGLASSSGITSVPAPVGGRRRRTMKKLRLVKKKTVRRMLARQGLKMRGGMGDPAPASAAEASSGPASTASTGPSGGRRKSRGKSHRKSHRRGKSLFGMRF
jgi:hypothetical protein